MKYIFFQCEEFFAAGQWFIPYNWLLLSGLEHTNERIHHSKNYFEFEHTIKKPTCFIADIIVFVTLLLKNAKQVSW